MKESAIQSNIIKMLEQDYEAYVVKVQVASKRGVPDILCSVNGIFLGIEVKQPVSKNNVSKLQEHNLTKIAKSGGFSMVAWSVDMVRDFIESEILCNI